MLHKIEMKYFQSAPSSQIRCERTFHKNLWDSRRTNGYSVFSYPNDFCYAWVFTADFFSQKLALRNLMPP